MYMGALTQFPSGMRLSRSDTTIQAELSRDETGRPKPLVAPDEAMAELQFL